MLDTNVLIFFFILSSIIIDIEIFTFFYLKEMLNLPNVNLTRFFRGLLTLKKVKH